MEPPSNNQADPLTVNTEEEEDEKEEDEEKEEKDEDIRGEDMKEMKHQVSAVDFFFPQPTTVQTIQQLQSLVLPLSLFFVYIFQQ